MKLLPAFLFLCLCSFEAFAQHVYVVRNSPVATGKTFLFASADPGSVIVVYERAVPSHAIVIETRRPSLAAGPRRIISLTQPESLGAAHFDRVRNMITLVLQNNETQSLSLLLVPPAQGAVKRTVILTSADAARFAPASRFRVQAKSIDDYVVAVNIIAGETIRPVILELTPDGADSQIRTIGSTGPVLDVSRGSSSSPGVLGCSGFRSDSPAQAISPLILLRNRLTVPGARSLAVESPEDVAYDNLHCVFGSVRRRYNEVVEFRRYSKSLQLMKTLVMPGSIATGLIDHSRKQLFFEAGRFFYPTVITHRRLYINLIGNSSVESFEIRTPLDFSKLDMVKAGDDLYLLIGGRTYPDLRHHLALQKVPLPSTALAAGQSK